ncbi:hypothetical protein KUV26_15215 [Leisingera daeponensis]|uniref:Aspartyl/asparaginy/proline hydroxylase domain-containing protein n=1 Tax=Leisingera daeponensis TaxID=405746 RepID=A0ABS7NHW6_9RHOB|nr:hypothetical protein [Leisingera daeponensis]MBY6058434.1 hypothetical protein [Leisingera daeponensis]MBY6140789.1 hypothetical protein [Leisingera daeponensis]
MSFLPQIKDADVETVSQAMKTMPESASVAEFVPGPGIQRLELRFDIQLLREALEECLRREEFMGGLQDQGFAALPLTRRPGQTEWTANDLSGRYWLRADDRYVEEPREDLVPEVDFSEFNPKFAGTYFEHVHSELAKRFPIGRTRVLSKGLYNCNSWHRDPEPRLHIPVLSNPGSLFIVNHHVTHLPADGSVYFTDTRGYHTALNGGETRRVHIVAALAYDQVTE